MTRLKAVCGCKWVLEVDSVISPTELIRQAQSHAEIANHTVILQGIIERPRKKAWAKPIERRSKVDHQRKQKSVFPTVPA